MWLRAAVVGFQECNASDPCCFSGKTFVIRAIMSFIVPPTDCDFEPVFGNVLEKQIRLDPYW